MTFSVQFRAKQYNLINSIIAIHIAYDQNCIEFELK